MTTREVPTATGIGNPPSSASDPRFHGAVDRSTGYATRSMLCVPVRGPGFGV